MTLLSKLMRFHGKWTRPVASLTLLPFTTYAYKCHEQEHDRVVKADEVSWEMDAARCILNTTAIYHVRVQMSRVVVCSLSSRWD